MRYAPSNGVRLADRTAKPFRYGLILDFDGLILETEASWYAACTRHFRRSSHLGERGISFREWAMHGAGNETAAVERIALSRNTVLTAADMRYMQAVATRQIQQQPVRADALALAGRCQAHGFGVAIATNGDAPWLDAHLRPEITAFVHYIECKGPDERGKPAPDIHTGALRGLGVSAERAIAVEDSVEGSLGATAASIRLVVVRPSALTQHHVFPPTTTFVTTLDAVTDEMALGSHHDSALADTMGDTSLALRSIS